MAPKVFADQGGQGIAPGHRHDAGDNGGGVVDGPLWSPKHHRNDGNGKGKIDSAGAGGITVDTAK